MHSFRGYRSLRIFTINNKIRRRGFYHIFSCTFDSNDFIDELTPDAGNKENIQALKKYDDLTAKLNNFQTIRYFRGSPYVDDDNKD